MHRLFAQAYFYSEIQDISDSFAAQPFSEQFDRFNFKVFRYSFLEAIFFIRLKSGFFLVRSYYGNNKQKTMKLIKAKFRVIETELLKIQNWELKVWC